jgi:hypothetical protein
MALHGTASMLVYRKLPTHKNRNPNKVCLEAFTSCAANISILCASWAANQHLTWMQHLHTRVEKEESAKYCVYHLKLHPVSYRDA